MVALQSGRVQCIGEIGGVAGGGEVGGGGPMRGVVGVPAEVRRGPLRR